MRVVAALSGGVDSAVAAARAVDAGHEVTAVHLALARDPAAEREGGRGCCSLEDARDARRVADVLGIPFYVWDLADRFESDVIDDFVAEYEAGRTPNPCLRCNERIKFAAMLDRALALGFDAVATGHYATLQRGPDGVELHRAVDPAKDQSYVLAVLESWQLEHAMFPLGDSTKAQVREEAARRGFLVAEKRDSHDICFIADGRTSDFLTARLGPRPGPIVDAESGETLGSHGGAYAFTVGQRRGLRLSSPRPDGAPRYVVGMDPATRTVMVGPESLLSARVIDCTAPVWTGPAPVSGDRLTVQVRAHGRQTPCTVSVASGDCGDGRLPGSGSVAIELDEPERGIASGQAAVLYDGSRVVGSATITSTSTLATVRD